MFYRAGYIESWGRGIQKICDACKNLGTDEPEYIVHGEDLMVKFKALQSAKVTEKSTEVHQSSPKSSPKSSPNDLNSTQLKIVDMILNNPKVTQEEMAEELNITARAVKKSIKELTEKGRIQRVGSARSGYWKIED